MSGVSILYIIMRYFSLFTKPMLVCLYLLVCFRISNIV